MSIQESLNLSKEEFYLRSNIKKNNIKWSKYRYKIQIDGKEKKYQNSLIAHSHKHPEKEENTHWWDNDITYGKGFQTIKNDYESLSYKIANEALDNPNLLKYNKNNKSLDYTKDDLRISFKRSYKNYNTIVIATLHYRRINNEEHCVNHLDFSSINFNLCNKVILYDRRNLKNIKETIKKINEDEKYIYTDAFDYDEFVEQIKDLYDSLYFFKKILSYNTINDNLYKFFNYKKTTLDNIIKGIENPIVNNEILEQINKEYEEKFNKLNLFIGNDKNKYKYNEKLIDYLIEDNDGKKTVKTLKTVLNRYYSDYVNEYYKDKKGSLYEVKDGDLARILNLGRNAYSVRYGHKRIQNNSTLFKDVKTICKEFKIPEEESDELAFALVKAYYEIEEN